MTLDRVLLQYPVRERGVLAEGAKFMMMNMDYNIAELIQDKTKEIRSFHFYQPINPAHPDLVMLAKQLNSCEGGHCRYI